MWYWIHPALLPISIVLFLIWLIGALYNGLR